MKLTSKGTKNRKPFVFDIHDWIHPKSALAGTVSALICASGIASWGEALILLFFTIFIISFLLVISDEGEWKQWFITITLIIMISTPGTFGPMIYDYNTEKQVDEVMEMEKHQLMFSDNAKVFVLIIEGRKQPLVLKLGDSYNRLKAGYLDGQLKPLKRKVKSWTDDEVKIVYSLDGVTFD